jgi:hypothetical protein
VVLGWRVENLSRIANYTRRKCVLCHLSRLKIRGRRSALDRLLMCLDGSNRAQKVTRTTVFGGTRPIVFRIASCRTGKSAHCHEGRNRPRADRRGSCYRAIFPTDGYSEIRTTGCPQFFEVALPMRELPIPHRLTDRDTRREAILPGPGRDTQHKTRGPQCHFVLPIIHMTLAA